MEQLYVYLVKNSDYEDKKVVACNMLEALRKYEDYLTTSLSYDYSPRKLMSTITSCECLGEYVYEDVIM